MAESMASFINTDSEPDGFMNINDYENNQTPEGEETSSSEGETSRHGQAFQSRETSTAGRQSETTNDNLRLKRRFGGAFKYKTKFQKSWTKTWPFVSSVQSDEHKFRCNVCAKVLSCEHQGSKDIVDHVNTAAHARLAKADQGQSRLSFSSTSTAVDEVTNAELKVANFLAHHNIPLAVADHLSPLLKNIFADSRIAKQFSSARTKVTCMINGTLAPECHKSLVTTMQENPFSLSTDGSNDNGLQKMNPLSVRIFDIKKHCVSTQLLDMCLTSGPDAGKAACIFEKIDEVMVSNNIPWQICTAFSLDNTSVNLGKHNSIKTRVTQKNPEIFFMGCPCHIVHNTAEKGAQVFSEISSFQLEELLVDIYFWFDKSTQRKAGLEDYCQFCDIEYRKILKHVSTRWLSLELVIDRVLKQYDALRSYFLSEDKADARFKRLKANFANPMTELYLLFFSSILPVFTSFNKFMQREDPCIYLLASQMKSFLQKLFGKFVKMEVIKNASLLQVKFSEEKNQLSDSSLFIGFTTKQRLLHLEREDITPHQKKKFYDCVRAFYSAVCEYAVSKFPWDDPVLENSIFVDFKQRETCDISAVEYFVNRYKEVFSFSASDMDHLQEEFIQYQLTEDTDIPDDIWQEALICIKETHGQEEQFHRMDTIWGYLSQCKRADSSLQYSVLSKVARAVLVLPHSNASEERIFSMVTKNKTNFRPSLKLDGTLSSILKVKLAHPEIQEPCYDFKPSKDLLKTAKKSTWVYNKEHSR